MYALIFLLVLSAFAIGVLVGVRGQEINLQGRERRLASQRRQVNADLRAIQAHHEVNHLIWEARDELRQNALVHAQGRPFVIDHEIDVVLPQQRNGTKMHRAHGRNN